MKPKNILITGGHVTPALALIEYLVEYRKSYQIHYIGRKHAMEGDSSLSFEYQAIKQRNVPFHELTTGRLQRHLSKHTLLSLLKVPQGFYQSYSYIRAIKPDVIVSFGGYVALPVSIMAWLLGVPIITHEQTSVMGLTNRIISKIASRVCVAWKDTKKVPPGVSVIVTGNPLRRSIYHPPRSEVLNFGDQKLPLLYVTGGSQGAHVINQAIMDIIRTCTKEWRVVHQCGRAYESADFNAGKKIRDDNYRVFETIDPDIAAEILTHADLVISRSGANTVSELAALQIPSILIPLPHAAENEQFLNAKKLEATGTAVILPQHELTPDALLNQIDRMKEKQVKKTLPRIDSSAEKIAGVIDGIV